MRQGVTSVLPATKIPNVRMTVWWGMDSFVKVVGDMGKPLGLFM